SLLLIVFVSGQATVTQKHKFLSVKEGDSILLDCSYQEMEYSLQWYKQYPGGQPEFMVLQTSPGTEAKDHFEMTLDTNNKATSLYLKNIQLRDSAVYFCAWEYSYYPVYRFSPLVGPFLSHLQIL
uniref:Ig-like domain-containing protein n=1 Tax=Naja naja TaxID=35670 RepID=A0A8C6VNL4_NAJNA